MREVENYVEHIRHLSEERETLIQELETENEQLKLALEQLHPELSGICCWLFESFFNSVSLSGFLVAQCCCHSSYYDIRMLV